MAIYYFTGHIINDEELIIKIQWRD